MVLLDVGATVLRDAISSDLSHGQAGTSTYPINKSQTALLTAVSDSLNTLSTNIKSSNTITVTHIVTTAESNASTLTEWQILGNSGSTDYNRVLRAGILKSSKIEITMITVLVLERV